MKKVIDILKNNFKVIVVVLLVVSLGCNGLLMYKVFGNSNSTTTYTTSTGETKTVTQVSTDVTSDLTDVIKKAQESTVGVAVYQNNTYSGSGSGVVYKVDGSTVYVITNHHVIEDASKIEVVFYNEERVEATLVGSDQLGDIAVLKMTVNFTVSAYTIGDSDLLDAGETVLAIGSPLKIENAGTVTQGIVSATNRTVSVDYNSDGTSDYDVTVIQTDAAINAGNSGGALINAVGELVGITSMKLSSTDIEGVGYAYPINDALNLVEQIMKNGKVTRPVLGITGTSLSEYYSYRYFYNYYSNSSTQSGVYVTSVQSNSAASKAGLKEGDIITEIDGTEISAYKDFLVALYKHNVGDKMSITINRNGTTKTLTATLQ